MGMQGSRENVDVFRVLGKGRIEGNHRGVNMRII
jgi:hypothetical protein